jgi:hypothetical protein
MSARLEDPVLRSSRREAVVCFGIWLAACTYTVGYCAVYGYDLDPNTLTFVAGIPSWVFYGIVLPWTICTLTSFWVSNFFMADEDLGEEQAEVDLSTDPSGERQTLTPALSQRERETKGGGHA